MSAFFARQSVRARSLLLAMAVVAPAASAQRSAALAVSATLADVPDGWGFDPAVDEPCAATVVRRETLRDSTGALLYVAPDVVLARDGELLLAGHASARFPLGANGLTLDDTSSAFVAVLRSVDGRVRTFAAPPALTGASLRDLRAVALPNRRWGVLFFNETTHPQRAVRATNDSLWFGILGPTGWEQVEPLPVPADVRLYLPVAQPMQMRGNTIAAAVPAERVGSGSGVLLLERTDATWRTRFLPTFSIAYAGLAFAGDTGALRLLAVHANPDPMPGSRSSNELYLYDPDRMGSSRTRLLVFPTLPARAAHHPTMLSVGNAMSIAWLARDRSDSLARQVPTHLLVRDGVVQPPITLGERADRVLSVPAGPEQVHVLTAHNSHVDTVQVDIRTLPALSRGVRLRHATTFAEVFGAGRWNDSTVVVTLLRGTTLEATSIATEVFWIKAQCSSKPEGSRVP
jgi:hypothetical protein